jgi:PAS domain S-box-containing protein
MPNQLIRRLTTGRQPIDVGFLLGATALALVGILSYSYSRRLDTDGQWVSHTYQVISHLDRVETQTLTLGHASDPATVTEVGTLREFTADNPAQRARVDSIAAIIDGPAADVLRIVDHMRTEESRLLAERTTRAETVAQRTAETILFSTLLAILLMGVAVALLRQDLKARAITEQALEDSESKHRLLMEQAADAILIIDSDAVCIGANARAAEMIGRPHAQIVGRPLRDFVRGQDARSPAALPMLRYGQLTTGEFNITRPDGSLVPVEIRATMFDDGRIQVIARDITERREVDRVKSEFVSMVSHELRTPLTSIRGALGLLAAGRLDDVPDKRQRMLELAAANSDRLIRLINNILDVERINSNAATFEQTECLARTIVEHVVDAIGPLAERAGIDLRWSADNVRIWADPDRMTQTVTNLVDNAIKFSAAGSAVEVLVRGGEAFATFSVADHGRGIPADRLESVFDRFQQIDASDSRDKGGSGLGLAICRGIVQQHGGRMWVESELGRGSTFYFTIPIAVDAAAHQETADTAAPL